MSAFGSIRSEASKVARPAAVPAARPAAASAGTVAVRTTDPTDDEQRPLSIAALWESSSSWLVSAIFHAVLLMILALTWITLTQQEKPKAVGGLDATATALEGRRTSGG